MIDLEFGYCVLVFDYVGCCWIGCVDDEDVVVGCVDVEVGCLLEDVYDYVVIGVRVVHVLECEVEGY